MAAAVKYPWHRTTAPGPGVDDMAAEPQPKRKRSSRRRSRARAGPMHSCFAPALPGSPNEGLSCPSSANLSPGRASHRWPLDVLTADDEPSREPASSPTHCTLDLGETIGPLALPPSVDQASIRCTDGVPATTEALSSHAASPAEQLSAEIQSGTKSSFAVAGQEPDGVILTSADASLEERPATDVSRDPAPLEGEDQACSRSSTPATNCAELAPASSRPGLSFSTLFAASRALEASPSDDDSGSRTRIFRTNSSSSMSGLSFQAGFAPGIPRSYATASAPGSPSASPSRALLGSLKFKGGFAPLESASATPSKFALLGRAIKKGFSLGEQKADTSGSQTVKRRFQRSKKRTRPTPANLDAENALPAKDLGFADSSPQSSISGSIFSGASMASSVSATHRRNLSGSGGGSLAGALMVLQRRSANAPSTDMAPPSQGLPSSQGTANLGSSSQGLFFTHFPVQHAEQGPHKKPVFSSGPSWNLPRDSSSSASFGSCPAAPSEPRQILTPFDVIPNPHQATAQWSQQDWYLFISAVHAGLRAGPMYGVPEVHQGATKKLLQELLVSPTGSWDIPADASAGLPDVGPTGSAESDSQGSESSVAGREKGRKRTVGQWGEPVEGGPMVALYSGPASDLGQSETLLEPKVLNSAFERTDGNSFGGLGPLACPHLAQLRGSQAGEGGPHLETPAQGPAHDVDSKPRGGGSADDVDTEAKVYRAAADVDSGPSACPHAALAMGFEAGGGGGSRTKVISEPATEHAEMANGGKPANGERGNDADGQDLEEEDDDDDTWVATMLDSLVQAKQVLLQDKTPNGRCVCEHLLSTFLDLTTSEMGFISSVHYKSDGKAYLKTHAITNIGWTPELRQWYADNRDTGLIFNNMNTLFGAAVRTGGVVISNKPEKDSRAHGVPLGHPTISAFLGIPLFAGGKLIGVLAAANSEDKYSDDLVEDLKPLIRAVAAILAQVLHRRHEGQVMQGIAEEPEEEEQSSTAELSSSA